MKAKKRNFEIFNMSFLDVISCGFGAVVLLVLISNFSENTKSADEEDPQAILAIVLKLEDAIESLSKELKKAIASLGGKDTVVTGLRNSAQRLQGSLEQRQQSNEALRSSITGLELVEKSLKQLWLLEKVERGCYFNVG